MTVKDDLISVRSRNHEFGQKKKFIYGNGSLSFPRGVPHDIVGDHPNKVYLHVDPLNADDTDSQVPRIHGLTGATNQYKTTSQDFHNGDVLKFKELGSEKPVDKKNFRKMN